jgi:hypothetical protein
MPAALTTCVEQKVNAIRPGELASLVFGASATQPGDAEARGERLGVVFAEQCFVEPEMRPVLLGLFLGPVERGLNAGHYPSAFKRCVLGKLREVASSELVRMAADPAALRSFEVELGRSAAAACIASGAKP